MTPPVRSAFFTTHVKLKTCVAFLWIASFIAAAIECVNQKESDVAEFWTWLMFSVIFLTIGLARFVKVLNEERNRARLRGREVSFTDIEKLRLVKEFLPKDSVYLGLGFSWGPTQSRAAYEATKVQIDENLPNKALSDFLLGYKTKEDSAIGRGWIHGIGQREESITVSEKALEGGTLIVGTTQSGKGVLLTLLITQAILKGDAVIVIDPKNSPRTLAAIDRATAAAGRKAAYVFHPNIKLAVRINPLANFTRVSEIASRITACLNETGPFAAFAWKAVYVAAFLMVENGETPTIEGIARFIHEGPEATVKKLAESIFTPYHLENAMLEFSLKSEREKLARAISYLLQKLPIEENEKAQALREGLALLKGNAEHEAKLIASLLPLLASLTSGNLFESLSPTKEDPFNPILDLKTLIERKEVLYIATDALADRFTASAIATLFLADLASIASDRYNKRLTALAASLFVDEASNAMSDALIELLNKGAESGIRTTCAMQTISDLAARLKSTAAARMALGNFNNLIALRTKDLETAKFVTETFGKTLIPETLSSLSSSSASDATGKFAANFTRRETATREELLSPEWLGSLPNTEYFASLAGGRIYKGRVPILVAKEDAP